MSKGREQPSGPRSKVVWVAGGISSVLLFFMVENIWIDPRLRHRTHRIPSFVPEAQSGTWYLAFVIGAIALLFLIVCVALLIKDRETPIWMKLGSGIAVILVLLLSVEWFRVTNGQPGLLRLLSAGRTHTVTLTWQASSSPVAGYNVYRTRTSGTYYVKINAALVRGLSYTDNSVDSGATYYYVTRAVDAHGGESPNSNEFRATVP
jgi:hypothetical protein